MKIKITTASNGAAVDFDYEEKDTPVEKLVYSFDEDKPEEIVHMLYDIMEHMGYLPSRYVKKRVVVCVGHGDKYECNDDKCFCKEPL